MIRPAFIPPDAPAPLLDLTTGRGLQRAAHIFGVRVAAQRMGYREAIDLLMQSYVSFLWDGEQHWRISLVERGLLRIMERQIATSESLMEWESHRDDIMEIECELADPDRSPLAAIS